MPMGTFGDVTANANGNIFKAQGNGFM